MESAISILQRRRIEAEFARALLPGLEAALGAPAAHRLLGETAARLAREHADALCRERGFTRRDLPELAQILPLWEQGGALEVTWHEKSTQRIAFDVTRCRYAEMYAELGMRELGKQLSCGRDGAFCGGFNPRLRFDRTQTLMEGASHCDFSFRDPGREAPANDEFRSSYVTARQLFRATAANTGCRLASYSHPHEVASDGSALTVDVACMGPDDAQSLFLTISGTHGVEGLVGSAAQVAFMRAWGRKLPPGVRAVLVHGINPWGFDRLGRTNESNVDLNRNFVDWERGPVPGNPDYALVHEQIAQCMSGDAAAAGEFSRRGIEALGRSRFFDAVTRGQYTHPTGLMYGGANAEWSNRTLEAIIHSHACGVWRATAIDWHSGLGERGEPYFLCFSPRGSDAWERACATWGSDRIAREDAFGDAQTPRYQGLLIQAVERWLAPAAFTGAVVEFGTRPYDEMLDALVADLRLHRLGAGDAGHSQRRGLLDAFVPADADWQRKVLAGAALIQAQAIEQLAGSCA